MKMQTLSILGAFLFLSTVAVGQNTGYDDYDGNMDGTIDRTEFDD
ncbi:hypothetical protein RM545_16805 [Zunongwangia sp. F260]|nr:hypothetical protein [Zunongwangia sp. F260]MDT0648353.1 hypothetical protein [Zunongwangia sp. F260]